MEQLLELDYAVFEWINHGWQHPWLDAIMPHWREKTTWIPLYLLAVIWIAVKHRGKAIYFFLALALTGAIADQLSSEVIKKNVERPRPCREASLEPAARALIPCGGGYSFTSSHATNHFAIALFLFLTWGKSWGRWKYLLFIWAGSIALGQVYVGVHYPIDITAGALLGMLIGFLGSYFYRKLPVKYQILSWDPPHATA